MEPKVEFPSNQVTEDQPIGELSEEEYRDLRIVPDSLPLQVWLLTAIEVGERFAFFGIFGPFQNYMQNEYGGSPPGAIGLGQKSASSLNLFFQFWCNVTPLIAAVVADKYLGRFKTVVYFCAVYILGLVCLFVTSLPFAIRGGASLGGLIAAMLLVGLGSGGVRANVCPMVAEQYTIKEKVVRQLKYERVIVDPDITIQRIYTAYYVIVCFGSLSALVTTYIELHIDFWAAYLLPLLVLMLALVIFLYTRKWIIARPPNKSAISHAFKAMWIGLMNRCNMDSAKPQTGRSTHRIRPWDGLFIDELKRALLACRVFLFFPIYWASYSQMMSNLISQAGTMETHGIPNDFMQNISIFPIITLAPLFEWYLYPALRKRGIMFKPISRMTCGFVLAALAMAYSTIVQYMIYSSPPCYATPLSGGCLDGSMPNKVHVAVQTPAYLLMGVSEIFVSITGMEYAYTKAPPSMKSLVTAFFLLMLAFGPAAGLILTPFTSDPKLLWLYASLAVATFVTGCIFWLCFRKYDESEESLNALDKQDIQVAVSVGRLG